MKVACFSSQPYDRQFLFEHSESTDLQWKFFESKLSSHTLGLAEGHQAVCCFVNDELDRHCLAGLVERGVRIVALRCAGFNNVDLKACAELGVKVARVPAYSPHAVAEHTVALLLCLNRKLHKSYNRVREGNFALHGLLGFDLHGKTVGVVGTGKIGSVVVDILKGFGCQVLAYDPFPSRQDIQYVELAELLKRSRVVSLHSPLTPETHHLIDANALAQMQPGTLLVNTSRGGLVDTSAVIDSLKHGHLGGLAIDVYEEEGDLFFHDLSGQVIQDDVFARLLTFPNVVISGHQAFFTREALTAISETTVQNLLALFSGKACSNEVDWDGYVKT
ncbi:MAG: 2-hydroxyacid dehydrogenase [Candidatus Eremiobacteraeota bacterium]|nr:2-hydroxyacid dehydrogenase [Candidatus Eremiobacteraeota bacterium]